MKDFRMDSRPANEKPRSFLSLVLTIVVHTGLLAFLFFGINWQSKPLGSLEVGLVGPSSPAPKPAPEPPTPKPPASPQSEPPKTDPVIEKPVSQPKPELATKKEKPKEPPKQEKPKGPSKPEKPERKARELKQIDFKNSLDKEIERSASAKKASDLLNSGAGAKPGELDAYRATVAAKIRRNLSAPPDLSGNPEAVVEIEQLFGNGGGEVVNVQLKRSSGNRALDEAILRAIRKSNPLPLPENRNLFERKLNLTFRPLEE